MLKRALTSLLFVHPLYKENSLLVNLLGCFKCEGIQKLIRICIYLIPNKTQYLYEQMRL